MRIGLNLLYLLPGIVGGTQTYATSLIRALTTIDQDNEYVVYVSREFRSDDLVTAPNLRITRCDVRAEQRGARYAYEQIRLPAQVRRDQLDVLHSLGYVGPLSVSCPHVVTIHDLIYVGFRDHMSLRRRLALRLFVRATARRADRVIAVSESSRSQVVADIGLDPRRVTVVHEAGREVGDDDRPGDPTVIERYGLTRPYVLAFGSLSASKNIPRLVAAFAEIVSEVDAHLVLVGHLPSGSDIRGLVDRLGLGERVVITGYVPDADVLPLIAHASLFAFPSLYEGFGLPILDAQNLGVPVVTSNAASLPEVAGSAALFFDPHSVEQMAAALRTGLTDAVVRRELVRDGYENAATYSWERAARETLVVYEEVVRG